MTGRFGATINMAPSFVIWSGTGSSSCCRIVTPTVKVFLAWHATIRVLSRDPGAGYGEAGAQALPDALQVADRWHLIENARAAFLDVVRKSMRAIRGAIGATTINPRLLTASSVRWSPQSGQGVKLGSA